MCASFELDLSPWEAMFEALGDIGTDTSGMEKAVDKIHQDVQSRAPVDTGQLRDSYRTKVTTEGDAAVGYVGTNLDYAIHQEYGTVHQSGTPHLRPALEANQKEFPELVFGDVLQNIG